MEVRSSKLSNPIFLNQPCVLCGARGRAPFCLCGGCLDELPFITHGCQTCGIPLVKNTTHCGACITNPPPVTYCISLLHYQEPVDYLIKRMKYHNQLPIADSLGKLLIDKLQHSPEPLPELIIPVPLHPYRLQQRGYNQAAEIAHPISRAFNIPISIKDCARTRNTVPQFDLPSNQRSKNMRNAFTMTRPILAKHVAIIDDIMTTGSTAWALSHTLLKANVKRVDIWVCARTD